MFMIYVFVFCDFERENHKFEICVWFVILKGKIIDLKFVFVILGLKIINQNLCF